ncbi:MAG: hypothetical protein HY828_12005 [Actinobacteria bacterium]|nr:hypothetical protein [Actinomycetota bacterium]
MSASRDPLATSPSAFIDALAGMLAGMSLDDAVDLLSHVTDPVEALRTGCRVLPGLLAQFRLHIGSRSLEWWQQTLEQSNVRTLTSHERESFLILSASNAGGVSFELPDTIRANPETPRLVAGLLQMATLVAVALQQAGRSRDDIIADCERWTTVT